MKTAITQKIKNKIDRLYDNLKVTNDSQEVKRILRKITKLKNQRRRSAKW